MRQIIAVFIALGAADCASVASEQPPVLEAAVQPLQVRDGDETISSWRLDRQQNPDVYPTVVAPGRSREVCFVAGENALCRRVRLGEHVDFFIRHEGFDYPTRIMGIPPAANFDAAYQAEHRGRVEVMVPEVYELVNIAIAMTPTARADRRLVARNTPYYTDVEAWFLPFAEHRFIAEIDRRLAANRNGAYYALKMNGFAFEINANGRIVRSAVYDRTGFDGVLNELAPMLELMQSFADQSSFRAFYAAHEGHYRDQVSHFENTINLTEMQAWLRRQFPSVTPYDGVRIVFSPLVGGNQSVTRFESNGYRELQPHVNFPYELSGFTVAQNAALSRGLIVFTEINHGYIDKPAEAFANSIESVFSDRALWVAPGSSADSYGSPMPVFLEMINWALPSLYFYDTTPPQERDAMVDGISAMMGERGRGFLQFPEFNRFLVDLYANRPPGATVESLYPAIIAWFETHAAATSMRGGR